MGAGCDGRMEPLANGTIRFGHLGELGEHRPFPVRLAPALAGTCGRLLFLEALLRGPSC